MHDTRGINKHHSQKNSEELILVHAFCPWWVMLGNLTYNSSYSVHQSVNNYSVIFGIHSKIWFSDCEQIWTGVRAIVFGWSTVGFKFSKNNIWTSLTFRKWLEMYTHFPLSTLSHIQRYFISILFLDLAQTFSCSVFHELPCSSHTEATTVWYETEQRKPIYNTLVFKLFWWKGFWIVDIVPS